MRITSRCRLIVVTIAAAGWLTTGQIRRRFFPTATADAARRRLRTLSGAGYLIRRQRHRMAQCLFGLGPAGRKLLLVDGIETTVERRLPKQLEHRLGVNDVRIAAELTPGLSYFFAYWELPGLGWRHPIIPDALFCLRDRTFAVELDRGSEGLRYFVRTKLGFYERGLPGLPLSGVLIIAETTGRMRALSRAISNARQLYYFCTIDVLREHHLGACDFYRSEREETVSLV